jgi:hypothetical protein
MSTTRLAAELGCPGWRFGDLLPGRPAWHTKAACPVTGPGLFSPHDRHGAEKLY